MATQELASASEIQRGIRAAMDPTNRDALSGGRGVTTLQSSWLHQACPVCRHTFRVGDEVAVDAQGTPRHDSPDLPCGGSAHAVAVQGDELTAFFRGLDTAWPPPQGIPVWRLELGGMFSHLLSPPFAGFRRHACAVCGHSLRPQDVVVICPCHAAGRTTRRCDIAIHRDSVRGLHCWDAWTHGELSRYCPGTSQDVSNMPVRTGNVSTPAMASQAALPVIQESRRVSAEPPHSTGMPSAAPPIDSQGADEPPPLLDIPWHQVLNRANE